MSKIAHQIFLAFFMDRFEDVTKEPHQYLLIILTQGYQETYRVGSGILLYQWPAVYLLKKRVRDHVRAHKINSLLLKAFTGPNLRNIMTLCIDAHPTLIRLSV